MVSDMSHRARVPWALAEHSGAWVDRISGIRWREEGLAESVAQILIHALTKT